jgi:hypothetical protein
VRIWASELLQKKTGDLPVRLRCFASLADFNSRPVEAPGFSPAKSAPYHHRL